MTSLLAAYLLGLLYFVAHPDKVSNRAAFRTAWIWFALIPFGSVLSTLHIASEVRSTSGLAFAEVWANGISWLLLGISLLVLLKALMPKDSQDAEQ